MAAWSHTRRHSKTVLFHSSKCWMRNSKTPWRGCTLTSWVSHVGQQDGERCRKARAGWAWAGCWTISHRYPTLKSTCRTYWNCGGGARFVVSTWLLWLSDGAGTHSSRTSGWSTLCDNRMRMLILNNFRTVEVPLWPPCFY